MSDFFGQKTCRLCKHWTRETAKGGHCAARPVWFTNENFACEKWEPKFADLSPTPTPPPATEVRCDAICPEPGAERCELPKGHAGHHDCGGWIWAAAVVQPPPASGEPRTLTDRIDAAIKRITSGAGAMRIPADPTDPDLVLAECKAALSEAQRERDEARRLLGEERIRREKAEEELVCHAPGLDCDALVNRAADLEKRLSESQRERDQWKAAEAACRAHLQQEVARATAAEKALGEAKVRAADYAVAVDLWKMRAAKLEETLGEAQKRITETATAGQDLVKHYAEKLAATERDLRAAREFARKVAAREGAHLRAFGQEKLDPTSCSMCELIAAARAVVGPKEDDND
jgi:hypothetical protein